MTSRWLGVCLSSQARWWSIGFALFAAVIPWALSRHDRDVNPDVHGSGRMRAVVGIYFAEEPFGPQEPAVAAVKRGGSRRSTPTPGPHPERTENTN